VKERRHAIGCDTDTGEVLELEEVNLYSRLTLGTLNSIFDLENHYKGHIVKCILLVDK